MGLTKVKINLGTQGNLSGSRSIIQSTKTLVSSSAQMHEEISGSFTAASSSFSTRVTTIEGSGTAQGVGTSDSPTFNNITATGTVTAQEFHSEFVSASVTFTSGSHKFGNSTDDVHNMTGSLNVSGAINLNDGNLSITDKMIIGSGSGFDFGNTNHSFTVKTTGNNAGFSVLASGGSELVRFIQESNDAGQMDFFDGGSLKIRLSSHANANNYINNGGNVGIGTNSPQNESSGVLLHIADTGGTNAAHINLSGGDGADGSQTGKISFSDPGDPDDAVAFISSNIAGSNANPGGTLHFFTAADGGSMTEKVRIGSDGQIESPTDGHYSLYPYSNNTNFTTYGFRGDQNTGMYRPAADNIGFATGGTQRLLIADTNISSSVNLSIIKGGATLNVEEVGGSKFYIYSGGSFTALRTTSNTPLQFGANYSSADAMYIQTDGRVSIKASSLPQDFGGERGHLLISSTDNAGANNYGVLQVQGHSIANDVALGILAFYDHSDEHGRIQVNRGDDSGRGEMIFSTRDGSSSAERMRIDRSGNVGIGTNNPAQPLHIRAATPSILFTDSSNGELGYIGDGADFLTSNSITAADTFGIRSSGAITIGTGGNNCRMVIESNGQIGIGTNSAHDNTDFEVDGNIGARKAFYHTKHQNNSLNKNGYSGVESGFIGDDMARQAIMYRTGHIYSSSGGTSSDFLTAYTSGHWGNHYHGWMYAWTTYYGTGHRKYRWHCSEGNLNLTQLETWGTDAQATITVGSQTSVGSGTHSGQNVQKQTFTLNTNASYVGAYATILVCYSASGFPHLDNASSASDVQSDATSAGARLHFLTMDITGSPHRDTT